MVAGTAALPLASKKILSSDNVDQIKSHLCGALRPHDILLHDRRSDLHFIHNQAQIGDIALNAMYYGAEVEIQAPEAAESYLFMLTLAGTSQVKQGKNIAQIGSGSVYVFNPASKLRISLSHNNQQLVLRIPKSNVERFLSSELSCSLRAPLEFTTRPLHMSSEVPGLQNFIRSMCADLDAEYSGYTQPQARKHVEQLLLSLILGSIPHNYSEQYRRTTTAPAPYFVRRAENFLHANLTETITLQDIAQASGVSLRSLQKGFQTFRNTTPMAYLRDLRLERVRTELLNISPARQTVTEIATLFGFTHLSKFAKYYKERYGECPSDTVKRGFIE